MRKAKVMEKDITFYCQYNSFIGFFRSWGWKTEGKIPRKNWRGRRRKKEKREKERKKMGSKKKEEKMMFVILESVSRCCRLEWEFLSWIEKYFVRKRKRKESKRKEKGQRWIKKMRSRESAEKYWYQRKWGSKRVNLWSTNEKDNSLSFFSLSPSSISLSFFSFQLPLDDEMDTIPISFLFLSLWLDDFIVPN